MFIWKGKGENDYLYFRVCSGPIEGFIVLICKLERGNSIFRVSSIKIQCVNMEEKRTWATFFLRNTRSKKEKENLIF